MNYGNTVHEENRKHGLMGEGKEKPSYKQLFRIKVLIEELVRIRAETDKPKFNMKHWCELARGKSITFLNKLIGKAIKNPCGTSCCLAGKAGLLPKIRRMGFKWEAKPSSSPVRGAPATGGFRYQHNVDDNAVKKFFGTMCYWEVFMDLYGISTLLQGIEALKRFHRRESNEAHLT